MVGCFTAVREQKVSENCLSQESSIWFPHHPQVQPEDAGEEERVALQKLAMQSAKDAAQVEVGCLAGSVLAG